MTLFLINEIRQIEELERLLVEYSSDQTNSLIVAFSLEIEDRLREKKITFVSVGKYKKINPDQLYEEDQMINMFFEKSRWEKFVYKDIFLPTIFKFMFRSYLQRVRYYGNLLISIIEANPKVKKIVAFTPGEAISETFGILAGKEITVIIDCATKIASLCGLSITVTPLSKRASVQSSFQPFLFSVKRRLFGIILLLWNTFIMIIRRPSHPRLLISDHWKNVGESVKLLPQGECIFLDRTEIRHADWKSLFSYRMRFFHGRNFLSSHMRLEAREETKKFMEIWKNMEKDIPPIFVWKGYSFDSILLDAVAHIVENFERIFLQIEETYALYHKLKPDVVMLRASVSGQTHFSILPLVAKQCKIPSIELQHGIEYLGPGSWSKEHVAEYIAVYGSLVKKELLSIGYEGDRIREIGSPRFDKQKSVEKTSSQVLRILCIAPDIRPFEIYDSYSAENYLASVAQAVKSLSEVHVTVKLRPGPADENTFRKIVGRVFSGTPHTIAQYEPLPFLYEKTDVVVSCFSTAILEALTSGVPVIIPAFHPVDRQVVDFHFSQYKEAGAVSIVYSHKEFAKNLSELARNPHKIKITQENIIKFISSNFNFDGDSSRRYTDLITELFKKLSPKKF